MAREEHDREDLLGEATAYVERIEFKIGASAAPVFIGFRRDGAASFYFGADPVFHFNSAQELRRAFVAGLLYRAERGRLVRLRRERTATETRLLRSEVSDDESAALLADLEQRLTRLAAALATGDATVAGQIPEHAEVMARTQAWLAQRAEKLAIADRPHTG
jgi:hypothetical protein